MNNRLNNILAASALAVSALLPAACSHNSWTVKGNVYGAEGDTLVLEASGRAGWYVLDTLVISGNGSFAASQPAAGYPDIYRLRLGNKELYFPVDSIETITIATSADEFGRRQTLSGSTAATRMQSVDSLANLYAAGSDSLVKRQLMQEVLADPSSIVAYYIVRKQVDGRHIFSPENPKDLRIIGAVANSFYNLRPNDPRTEFLVAAHNTYNARRLRNAPSQPGDTLYVQGVNLFDIELNDNQGTQKSLADVAAKNKVVILNYTVYGGENSPELNVLLNGIYEKYHNRGLEIFQLGLDEDQYQWLQSAKNLPWITVYQSPTSAAQNLTNYNVTYLPTTFLIVNGEIEERVTDLTKLESSVSKYL